MRSLVVTSTSIPEQDASAVPEFSVRLRLRILFANYLNLLRKTELSGQLRRAAATLAAQITPRSIRRDCRVLAWARIRSNINRTPGTQTLIRMNAFLKTMSKRTR